MTESKLQTLFHDQAFVDDFAAAVTPEDALALLKAQGAELALETVKAIRASLAKPRIDGQYVDDNGRIKDELSPDELESASGGTLPSYYYFNSELCN